MEVEVRKGQRTRESNIRGRRRGGNLWVGTNFSSANLLIRLSEISLSVTSRSTESVATGEYGH